MKSIFTQIFHRAKFRNFKLAAFWQNICILLVLVPIALVGVEGRRCYSCSTELESDQLDCLYNVENITQSWNNVSVIYCTGYCTIRREEYSDYPGGINRFNRSCENLETKLDEVIVSGYFITYLRSCRRDLCNSGDGIQSLKDVPDDLDLTEVKLDFSETFLGSSANGSFSYNRSLYNFYAIFFFLVFTRRLKC